MKCKNCFENTTSNFCANCGQKVIKNKLNFKDLFNQIKTDIFNIESVLLNTLLSLFIKPRQICSDYINGKRKAYINPLKLLVVLISIKTFIEIKMNAHKNEVGQLLFESGYFKFIILLFLIPILAGLAYLFFKKYKYNFTEHVVIASYLISATTLISFLFYLVKYFLPEFKSGVIILLVDLVICIWFYSSIFRNKIIFTILKSAFIYIIALLLFYLPIAIISRNYLTH